MKHDDSVHNPSSDPWFCSVCIHNDMDDSCQPHTCDLQCICVNARSLFPKHYDLLGYLSSSSVETFLDDTILSSQLCPPQYTPFHRDCDWHGGGVLILIKFSLPDIRRTDLKTHCEMLWVQIQTRDGPVLFGVFYHPTILEEMNAAISSIPGNYSIVICGDFYVPNIDWSVVTPIVSSPVNSTFCSLVHDNFLTQLVSSPTRGDHILDLILTNNPSCVSNVRVADNLPGSNYDAVEFALSVSSKSSQILFNYSTCDLHKFQEVLSHILWNCIPTDNGVEYAWQCWRDLFFSVATSVIPNVKLKQ